MTAPLLKVDDLHVRIGARDRQVHAVRGISFEIARGETLSIVGESGCGKSMTSLAVMGLLPRTARRESHGISIDGARIDGLSDRAMSDLRGLKLAMIFQEPMTALNPVYTIGNQLEEAYRRHNPAAARGDARARAVYLLEKVGITAASERLNQYPHQLSGGLRQRVMIAMALMCGPDLIIADEPTTALDVTIQAQILRLLRDLQTEFNLSILLITHDLGIVARTADKVAVMYAGEFVETGTAREVFNAPAHPYTRGLLAAIPVPGKTERGGKLAAIPGTVPSLTDHLEGCSFFGRCSRAVPDCALGHVALTEPSAGRAWRCRRPYLEEAAHQGGALS
ncbi:ABC transporter ATP-binding protein [Microvirga antarctica]|uniref:ABC transporter ATP-binding protein n=1 Tax=Microvirga antarctica TaxID=2819233 RepID=UPI001B31001E|nr:ABC transporter ATP-binding protein [Microvirga antarctica]